MLSGVQHGRWSRTSADADEGFMGMNEHPCWKPGSNGIEVTFAENRSKEEVKKWYDQHEMEKLLQTSNDDAHASQHFCTTVVLWLSV